MGKVYIREYVRAGKEWVGGTPIASAQEPGTDQPVITTSGTSAQSQAFAGSTRFVRVQTDAIVSFVFGDNPVATINNARMPANGTEYFGVTPGMKLAVIDNT